MDKNQFYDFAEALSLIKTNKKTKFVESIDVSINLDMLPKSKNFILKGYSILPHGEPKVLKIAVFTSEKQVSDLGGNYIILSEFDINSFNKKKISFDLIVTTPSSMIKFGKASKLLGSKNLMPDLKYGTITNDIISTLDLFKKNYVRFKSDKNSVINSRIGDLNLNENNLVENFNMLISDIKKHKPKDCKGVIVKSMYLTSTMGRSFKIDAKSFLI